MAKKDKEFEQKIKMAKQVSRILFSHKPTKVKPSAKMYSRKKKELPGIFFILPFLNLYKHHRS